MSWKQFMKKPYDQGISENEAYKNITCMLIFAAASVIRILLRFTFSHTKTLMKSTD